MSTVSHQRTVTGTATRPAVRRAARQDADAARSRRFGHSASEPTVTAPAVTSSATELPAQTCATCLVPVGSADATATTDAPFGVAAATCPECGTASVDYGYLVAISTMLDSAERLEVLDAAIFLQA